MKIFRNVQIILSTHGEQFIFKLQDKLGKQRYNRDAITYKFIPADSLEERGVVAEYSDAKAPLDAAEKNMRKMRLKTLHRSVVKQWSVYHIIYGM